MKTPAKSARVNSALQVLENVHSGMTVVDACREVGLPRSSFYDIVRNNPEAISEYQELVEDNARQQLRMILLSQTEILQRVIEDALSDETAPRDRLAIHKALDDFREQLQQSLQVANPNETIAHDFLKKGPNTATQKSRYITATMETVTIEETD